MGTEAVPAISPREKEYVSIPGRLLAPCDLQMLAWLEFHVVDLVMMHDQTTRLRVEGPEHWLPRRRLRRYFTQAWPRSCGCGTEVADPGSWYRHLEDAAADDQHKLQPPAVFEALRRDMSEYELVVNGQSEWLSPSEAAVIYDAGQVPVQFGERVRDPSGLLRAMTPQDRHRISDAADEISK